MLSHFSRVRLSVTLWTSAHQAPLSMEFSRQEYWRGLTCLPPGDLPDPGIKPKSLMSSFLTGRFFTTWEGFPGGSDGRESARNVGDLGSIPGLGRSPGGGHGNPLQYSFLENPMDRGATVYGSQRVRHDWATKHHLESPSMYIFGFKRAHFKNLLAIKELKFYDSSKLFNPSPTCRLS